MSTGSDSSYTASQLRDLLITASEEFGTLLPPRPRLEHLSAVLFLKRASDVFDEETAAAIEEFGPAVVQANPDAFHLIRMPVGASWKDIRGEDKSRWGAKLDEALRAVANANSPYLKEVFNTTDFNNRQLLPAADLADVVRAIHKLGDLRTARVSPELLGDAFLQVVDHFSRLEKPAKGEVFTPGPVARLGACLLAPEADAQVHDPACGSAGLLLRVRDEARRLHGDAAGGLGLFGQERKPSIWLIARMNTLFHGAAPASRIERGDSVLKPAFFGKQEFDLAICNPPFELEDNDWHASLRKAGDPFGRITHVPGKTQPDMVFVQHMVASLTESGRMAVLLPNGALFRARQQQAVRRDLIETDVLEAVIELPRGMFHGSGITVSWVIVNKAKPPDRHDRVLFIDASKDFERIKKTNILREQDIDRIVGAFRGEPEEEGFSAWVSRDAIRARRYDLTLRRYLRPVEDETDLIALPEALNALDAARAEADVVDRALEPLLVRLREASTAAA